MTPKELQDGLADEIGKILKGIAFKAENGKLAGMRTFGQELPRQVQRVSGGQAMPEEDEEESDYPFCVVRIESGELDAEQGIQEIRAALVFGIYDDDPACQGHQVIMTMIQRVMERFTRNPVLNDRYWMNTRKGISWVLDESDSHPYYHGAMTMSWDTFFVEREDSYV